MLIGKGMEEVLRQIVAHTNPTKFVLYGKSGFIRVNNLVPICMRPPICTFTSEVLLEFESKWDVFMSNTLPESKTIDKSHFLPMSLHGRVLHISPLPTSYIYLFEITTATH